MEIDLVSDYPLEDKHRRWIEKAIHTVWRIEDLPAEGEVSVLVVNEEKMTRLNQQFRHINRDTDVLSFPQFEDLELIRQQPYLILGDIVLNMDRVKDQAQRFGHGLHRELAYLVIHSMYHLLGYDHVEESDKAQMRKKEEAAYQEMEEE